MTALKILMGLGLAGLVATAAPAQESEAPLTPIDAEGLSLEDFKWTNRPVIVFADSPADPRFDEQMRLLQERPQDMIDRDVVVIVDTDPAAKSELRTKLRPRGFMLVLIGKDGGVKLRKPSPWSTRELSRSIDKMPMRQREIREEKANAG